MTTDIQRGDVVTHLNGSMGTSAGKPAPNCWGSFYVSVFDGRFYMPWDVTWMVRIERNGFVVWDKDTTPVQLELFGEE